MKCRECRTKMIKNRHSHVAICPSCGRMVGYGPRAKQQIIPDSFDARAEDAEIQRGGCSRFFKTMIFIVLIGFLLLIRFAMGDRFWTFVGNITYLICDRVWNLILTFFRGIGHIITRVADLFI